MYIKALHTVRAGQVTRGFSRVSLFEVHAEFALFQDLVGGAPVGFMNRPGSQDGERDEASRR